MKNTRVKKFLAYFFLLLFIAVKTTGLHGLSHDHDEEQDAPCLVCEYAISLNTLPVLNNPQSDFEGIHTEVPVVKTSLRHYAFIPCKTDVLRKLYSRPPPPIS